MKISVRTARLPDPFSSAFIRGEGGEAALGKNKKNSQNEVNPTSENYLDRMALLTFSKKEILANEPDKSLITNEPAILRNINQLNQ
jgi:hypothetical protein